MTTGIIIQARMGGTRLPGKVLMPIAKVAALTWCIGQAKKMEGIDKIVLAVPFGEEDLKFESFCYGENIYFFQHSQNDLIMRYLRAAQEYEIDTIIRLTGDSPVFSPEIGEILLKSHIETGADYTEAKKAALGTSCQIWNQSIFHKLDEFGIIWQYTEHMSYFVVNRQDIYKVNQVDLPSSLIRDYRLTLDYQEDLYMFNKLFETMENAGVDLNRFDIMDVFSCLDDHPEIVKINAHCQQAFDNPTLQAELKRELERINL